MATFGDDARFDDEPWGDHRQGRDGVRSCYVETGRARYPTTVIDVGSAPRRVRKRRSGGHDSGTMGPWRGLPATGRRVAFPLCLGLSVSDSADRLLAEWVYYDRAAVLGQLGMCSHEPFAGAGSHRHGLESPTNPGARTFPSLRKRKRPGLHKRPNMRVQRTRSSASPPHSPLTRHPLGSR